MGEGGGDVQLFASYRLGWVPWASGHFQKSRLCATHLAEIWRAPGARGYRLVYLYKADGGPHVCLLFAFRNCPIATPYGASEVHSRGGPDFKGIAPPNTLRTRGSGRINSLQIRLPFGLRTWATLTEK